MNNWRYLRYKVQSQIKIAASPAYKHMKKKSDQNQTNVKIAILIVKNGISVIKYTVIQNSNLKKGGVSG